ncbi:alpha,alpha-trehalase nth1, partial [Entomortierella lignicola]
ITKSFVDFNGVVPEKFDVVNMTHRVQVEYGNVGVDFKFIPREGFGWMNASYQVGLGYMDRKLRRALGAVMEPTRVFGTKDVVAVTVSSSNSNASSEHNPSSNHSNHDGTNNNDSYVTQPPDTTTRL